MHRTLILLTLMVSLSLVAVVWLSQRKAYTPSPPSPALQLGNRSVPETTAATPPAPVIMSASAQPTFPHLRLDTHGHLIIDRHLRQFFDAHFGHGLTNIDADMQRNLQLQLGPEDVAKAMLIYHNYRNYEDALAQHQKTHNHAALNSRIVLSEQAQIDQLRTRYLGADIDQALFPQPHLVNSLTVDQLSILQNPNLNQDDKIQQLTLMQKRLEAFAHKQDQLIQEKNQKP